MSDPDMACLESCVCFQLTATLKAHAAVQPSHDACSCIQCLAKTILQWLPSSQSHDHRVVSDVVAHANMQDLAF